MKYILHPATFILGYLLAIIITFGHAFHDMPLEEKSWFAGVEYTIHNGPGFRASTAFMCAIAWPLYWSAYSFRK
jgi:hypothetical protein